MIIKTKIDWMQNKKLSDEEKEIIEAKKAVLDNYNGYDEEYEETEKEAVIDTVNDKIYIQVEENKICLIRLLGGDYFPNEQGVLERIEERIYFQSNLDDVFKQLKEELK